MTHQHDPSEIRLTRRESELVVLLIDGLSSKQIAARLNVSKHTIDTQRRNLLRKTGAKNTIEMVVWCVRRGLV